ncbi:MAG: DedA family protein [Planctomycetota bacterium]|nr:MAG: DedA family protein [Planctomycetota bacterium]
MRLPLLHPLSRLLKRGYDWMLRLAKHPWASGALFALSFAEASFFPLPPDPLLLAMGASKPERAPRYALLTVLGSVLGAFLGYAIGVFLMDSVGRWLLDFYDPDRGFWHRVEVWYAARGFFGLLIAAITPIPFKVFTIASGALAFPLPAFATASLIGRGLRFGAEGLLLRWYGPPILVWVERWFNWVAIGFTVLLVGGFLLFRYI